MRSNKELTTKEFLISLFVKRAMAKKDDPEMVSEYLKIVLREIYR